MIYEFYDCGKLVAVYNDANVANDFIQSYYKKVCYGVVLVSKITDKVITFDLDVV